MNAKRVTPRKPDSMFEPTFAADVNSARVQSAIWDWDRAMAEVNAEWGHDRLPYLVSAQTRAAWWKGVEALWEAVRANDPEQTEALVENLTQKGIRTLRDEATAAGAGKLDPRCLETAMPSGGVLCVVQSWPEHAHRPEPRPDVQVYTIEEIARLLDSQFSLVEKTKKLFPDATVVAPRKADPAYLDDEVPF